MTILGIATAAGWILYLSSPAPKGPESTTSVEHQPPQTNEQLSELKTQLEFLTADHESLIQENLALHTLNEEALNETKEEAIRFSEQLDKNNAELKKALQGKQEQSEKNVQLTERLKQVLEISNDATDDLQPATDSGSEVSEVADTSIATPGAVAESSRADQQELELVKNLKVFVDNLQNERLQLHAKVDQLEKIQEAEAIRFSEQFDKKNAELKKALQGQQEQSEKNVQLTERLKQVLEISNDAMDDLQPATDSGSEVSEVADTSIATPGAIAESSRANQQELELVKNLKVFVDNLQNERLQLLAKVDQLEKIQEAEAIRFSEQLDKKNAELKKTLQGQQEQSEKNVQLTERLKQVLEISNDATDDLQSATDSGSEVSEVADTSIATPGAVAESSRADQQELELVNNLKVFVDNLQNERLQLHAKVDLLTTQLENLSQSASQNETAVSDTTTGESAPEQTAHIESAETTTQIPSEVTSELSSNLDELNIEVVASLKESVSNLKNQLQTTQNEVDRLALQLDSSNRRAKNLEIRLRYASKHLRRHRAKVRETEVKSGNLEIERQELQENLSELSSTLKQSITENKTEMALLVSKFSVIRLESDVIFDSGSAKLSTQGLETLREIAQKYQDFPDRIMSIEGHTDNRLITGNLARFYPTNWELSAARAAAAAHLLTQQGIPEDKLRVVGFGALQPIASNDTEEGRASNRRIEIRLAPKLSEAETD